MPIGEIESAIWAVVQMRANEPVVVGKEEVRTSMAFIGGTFAFDMIPVDAVAMKIEHEQGVTIAVWEIVASIDGETAVCVPATHGEDGVVHDVCPWCVSPMCMIGDIA